MQTSIYLARLIGPALAVVGLSMLVNTQGFLAIATEMIADAGLLYFAAAIGLIAGIALVLAHNIWTADWRVIVTLLAWISIVDSTSWLLAPRAVARFWAPVINPSFVLVGGAIVLILGAALCWFGYFAQPATRRRK
jgi:hypothetical protein